MPYLTASPLTAHVWLLVKVPTDTGRTFTKVIYDVLHEIAYHDLWEEDPSGLTLSENSQALLEMWEGIKEVSYIGQVSPFLRDSVPPGWLACDGTTHDKDDYPELYNVLPASMKNTTLETFTIPDMEDLYIAGAGNSYTIGDTFGEASHTLTASEMPVHSHSETAASAVTVNGGLEAPAASAVPTPATTGTAGGGAGHENRPPTIALSLYVFAGR